MTAGAVVERYFVEVVGGRRLDLMEELHTSDYVWHSPSGTDYDLGGTHAYIQRLFDAHDPDTWHLEVDDLVEVGDTAIIRFTIQAYQTSEWLGQPGDRRVIVRCIAWCRVEADRIAEEWEVVTRQYLDH